MPRRVKRNCSSSTRKSRRVKRMRRSKKCSGCGCRKRRQSRRSMRGGYNEAALQKVLDAALRGGGYGSGSSGLGGSRLNGGQSGGSRRRRTKRVRRTRRSMRGGEGDDGDETERIGDRFGPRANMSAHTERMKDIEFDFGWNKTPAAPPAPPPGDGA